MAAPAVQHHITMPTHCCVSNCTTQTDRSNKVIVWRLRGNIIWTRYALQCPLFPTFPLSVTLLMVIWSYLEQGHNSATGHSVWLVRSPGTVYHLTFVWHLHYRRSKWCSRHICFLDPTSVTNCLPEYEQWTLCGALVVTLAMLLSLINCRFIIIIISSSISISIAVVTILIVSKWSCFLTFV